MILIKHVSFKRLTLSLCVRLCVSGSPPTGGAEKMKLSCVMLVSVTRIRQTHTSRRDPSRQGKHCQCILTVRHILVECNPVAQTGKAIFGRTEVVESDFHPLNLYCYVIIALFY